MNHTIITIGRQYGSGGREIGEKLAEELGYAYYDTLLLDKAAEEGGLTRGLMERYDEKRADQWLNLSMAGGINDPEHFPVPTRAALAQFEAIRKIGEKESAVIVGRCSDYVLREQDNVLSVFVHAGMEHRIRRVMDRNSIGKGEAERRIRSTDKNRASYYNYYTDKQWGVSESYHLCVDSGLFGIEGVVKLLKESVRLFQTEREEQKGKG